MLEKSRRNIILLVLVLSVFACAITAPQTPSDTYLQARLEFNSMVGRYLTYYNQAAPETQAKWKAEIDPKILATDKALDAWGVAIKGGIPSAEQMNEYLDLKNELIDMLAEVYGSKEGV